MTMNVCSKCSGLIPEASNVCPNCRAKWKRKVALGASLVAGVACSGAVSMTLMACYGCPDCTLPDRDGGRSDSGFVPNDARVVDFDSSEPLDSSSEAAADANADADFSDASEDASSDAIADAPSE